MGERSGMIETNQLICGDACIELGKLPSESIDLVIADPPYNLGKDYGNNLDLRAWHEYEAFTQKWLWEIKRVLKPTGSLYVFMGVRFISKLFLILDEEMHFIFNGWITWHYTQGMGRKQGFSPRHEDILYFTKTDKFTFQIDDIRIPQKYYRARNNMQGANPGDVWEFSHVHYCSEEREKHPTQKPEALVERIIRASSNEGDIVLDPFVGSGTTCYVSHVLGRKWIGIDINQEYLDMTKSRLSKHYEVFDSYDPRTKRTPRDLPLVSTNNQKVFFEEHENQ
jgi:site-specific DNA-methyltransferase (adenine-specific)